MPFNSKIILFKSCLQAYYFYNESKMFENLYGKHNAIPRLKCRCDKTVWMSKLKGLQCPIIIHTTTDCDNGRCDYGVFHHLYFLMNEFHECWSLIKSWGEMEVQKTNIYCLKV